ncbi:FecR domain-containing protein [Segatella bryantii]|uniref:FecR family protein n=1 Tax=Segatella bryantii TaxID=77095 RepID=UPI001EDC6286|nr:FecR family protein [Segatella bryantii]UKK74728.1 FecR domain-containing protein [Segatella bryantii]
MNKETLDNLLHDIQEHCGEDEDLVRRYDDYAATDAEKALKQMLMRTGTMTRSPRLELCRRYRYAMAAAVAAFLVCGLFWWCQYTKVIPPTVSEEVQHAIAMSQKSGRQEASVTPFVQNLGTQTVSENLRSTYHIQEDEVVEQLLTAKQVTTRSNKEFWLTLPDGSLVHLNYNTHIIYPEKFVGNTRDVLLDGEAYFMVAKDRLHPFRVHTPHGMATAYGTEFNVSTRGKNSTEIVLVNGSVGVTPSGSSEQLMRPKQKCSINDNQCLMENIDVEPYVAWNTGHFVFEDCQLWRLMDVLSRWYGMKVQFLSEPSREILFTGILSRYNEINASLEAIATVAEVDIRTEGNVITIK